MKAGVSAIVRGGRLFDLRLQGSGNFPVKTIAFFPGRFLGFFRLDKSIALADFFRQLAGQFVALLRLFGDVSLLFHQRHAAHVFRQFGGGNLVELCLAFIEVGGEVARAGDDRAALPDLLT
jgi:hypothetical protein